MMSRVFIDVREPDEFANGHVAGAINIPPSELMAGTAKLDDVAKDTELVVYCLSGNRANSSMPYLKQMGYENLVNGINREHVEAKYSLR